MSGECPCEETLQSAFVDCNFRGLDGENPRCRRPGASCTHGVLEFARDPESLNRLHHISVANATEAWEHLCYSCPARSADSIGIICRLCFVGRFVAHPWPARCPRPLTGSVHGQLLDVYHNRSPGLSRRWASRARDTATAAA
jgi:hypothetical protein